LHDGRETAGCGAETATKRTELREYEVNHRCPTQTVQRAYQTAPRQTHGIWAAHPV
jgi:hypothetical protein